MASEALVRSIVSSQLTGHAMTRQKNLRDLYSRTLHYFPFMPPSIVISWDESARSLDLGTSRTSESNNKVPASHRTGQKGASSRDGKTDSGPQPGPACVPFKPICAESNRDAPCITAAGSLRCAITRLPAIDSTAKKTQKACGHVPRNQCNQSVTHHLHENVP